MDNKEFRERLLKPLDQIHNEVKNSADRNGPFSDRVDSGMSIMKYISNPTGTGSAYVANRAAIKQGLNMTYIKLLRNYRRAFYAVPYIYPSGDILFYVKVPSEDYKHNKISYDVCFLLKYDSTRRRVHREIGLFSNSPSFIFTYCYAYNLHGLVIESLKSKLPRECLTQPARVRNPINSLGFEKSTYIAARYLVDGGCLNDEYINRYSKNMNSALEADLINKIADSQTLIAVYQHAQYLQRKTHRKELSDEEKKRRNDQKNKYAAEQIKNRPTTGFIVHRSPRSKLTARRAQRSLLNDNKKR